MKERKPVKKRRQTFGKNGERSLAADVCACSIGEEQPMDEGQWLPMRCDAL